MKVTGRKLNMSLDKIVDKYVICSFGIDSHKLVKVISETKAKFSFHIYNDIKNVTPPYTQMKNTIIAVADNEYQLREWYTRIADYEKQMEEARINRRNLLKLIQKYEAEKNEINELEKEFKRETNNED